MGVKMMSVRLNDIPRFVIDELHVLIGDETKEKLLKFVLTNRAEDPKTSIDAYIRNILNEIFFSNDELIDLLELKNTYYRRRQLTKKNWYKQLKKEVESNEFTPLHAEINALKKVLESKTTSDEVKESIKGVKEPDQYIKNRLKEIEDWSNDRVERLTDYAYLDSKKPFQIVKAFDNEIAFIICDFFRNQPKNWISHRFKDLIDNPIFSDGRAKFKGNITFDSEHNTPVIYDDYKLSDNRILRSFISLEKNEEIQLDRMFYLDEKDSEILEYMIEQRDKRFYTEKKFVFDLRPLLLRIYGSTSTKAYEMATSRLKKIGRFSFEGRTTGPQKETKTSFLYNLFQNVKVTKDELSGRVYAEMQLSDSLHEQLITNQTVQIYSHFIHRLENRLSKILIYAFQKERLDAYLQERSLKRNFDYTFFTDRIRFRSNKIESNMSQIDSSLQEFKKAKILIEDYKRVGNGFDITLTPLTDSEKMDFFKSSNDTLIESLN